MRGTPHLLIAFFDTNGIIPAHAGNTTTSRLVLFTVWDHPRVCGEHAMPRNFVSILPGSSPRMRGTQTLMASNSSRMGIIPVYAGNTRPARGNAGTPWDHPRVCGEHYSSNTVRIAVWGSSPRMRGTPGARVDRVRGRGIIPAYAGNTRNRRRQLHALRDHPRVCGEHRVSRKYQLNQAGSSPRMRGTPQQSCTQWIVSGIIPAYAGNTPTARFA